jgi:histidine triad (HIT) family protein
MDDCLFCKIIKGEVPANMVYENDKIFAFLDINPNNKGHTLVVPKQHCTDLLETPDDVLADMMSRTKKIAEAIMKAVNADGFNTILNTKPAAGQVIFHTHLHIIPRFKDDGFKHWPHQEVTPEDLKKVQDLIKQNLQ